MTPQSSTTSPRTARMARNAGQLLLWSVAWVASLALAKFGPGALWTEHAATTVAAIAFNLLLGLGLLLSHKRHLRALDELERTVQLHAMAWALGAGLIGGGSWKLIEGHALVDFNAGIPQLLVLMAVVYIVAILVGTKRYL